MSSKIITYFFWGVLTVVAVTSCIDIYYSHKKKEYEYFDLGAVRKNNTCISASRQLPYWEVDVEFVESDVFAGQWSPWGNKIRLVPGEGDNVDTVAHEVYHMVEDKMEGYNITDPHVGAYLQGSWTACVLDVVHHHEESNFVFSE